MQIPNADRAVIEPMKLHAYLLAHGHPIGRFKSVFFNALGYSADRWRRLEADLRSQHLPHDATLAEQTQYGQKYSIRAALVGPSGRSAGVMSVWIVRTGEELPRFVTAYPEVTR